jgi:hypothetical protein
VQVGLGSVPDLADMPSMVFLIAVVLEDRQRKGGQTAGADWELWGVGIRERLAGEDADQTGCLADR